MKRILIYILVIMIITSNTSCSNSSEKNNPTQSNIKTDSPQDKTDSNDKVTTGSIQESKPLLISDKEIKEFFLSTKDDLLSRLGNKYEIVGIGAEGTYDGYYYKDLGLKFAFDNGVSWIECNDDIIIHGVHGGMSFDEVMKILGNTEVEESWIETPYNKTYEIYYDFDGFTLWFTSSGSDGQDTWLDIIPERIKAKTTTTEEIKSFFSLKEDQLIKYLGDEYEEAEGYGPAFNRKGYIYKDRGFALVFSEDKTLEFIELNDFFIFNGKKLGNGFNEMKEVLGDSSILETVDNSGESQYELRYQYDGFDICCFSCSQDGMISLTYILRNGEQLE